jgi:ATP-dependent Zn protease
MNDYDVVAKISIVPRGPAGGVTIFMPSEERLNSGLYSKVPRCHGCHADAMWSPREREAVDDP